MTIFSGIALALLVFAASAVLLVRIVRSKAPGDACRPMGAASILAYLVACLMFGALLLRPHQDTLQGLDCSAFRLMASAIAEGRPMQGVDKVLLDVPLDLRKWLLLSPYRGERFTRDRSFEIVDRETCATRPYFYPILPLSMAGFDAVVPGRAADYFVPMLGLMFCIAVLWAGLSRAGVAGLILAMAFMIGSPLPAWQLRGSHLEAVAGVLIGLSLLSWFTADDDRKQYLVEFFALGLAVSFHPVMAVLAVPLAGVMLFDVRKNFSSLAQCAAGFSVGALPLFVVSKLIVSPYGELTLRNFRMLLATNASIRPAFFFLLALVAVVSVTFAFRRQLLRIKLDGAGSVVLGLALVAVCVVPTWAATMFWEGGQGGRVKAGLLEMLDGLQWPFGLVVGAVIIAIILSRQTLRQKFVLAVVGLSLPLFLYLKGVEQMGLWSQRRLIVPWLIVLVCCIAAARPLLDLAAALMKSRRAAAIVCSVLLIAAGLHNFVRWPSAYLNRFDKGGDAWIDRMSREVGTSLAFFDYYGYSVPLSAVGNHRAIGFSERGLRGLPGLVKWLAGRAGMEEVLFITAYSNPGLEDGVILREKSRVTARLQRAHSKTVLPAEREDKIVDVRVLKATPIKDTMGLYVEKTFDRGPIALRGPWGSWVGIRVPDEDDLPGRWSRDGSGIIGPVPASGKKVRITVKGTAGRHDSIQKQVLMVTPPWGDDPASFEMSNVFATVSADLSNASTSNSNAAPTGTYTLRSLHPYNPALLGVNGFDPDLGALVHSIRIEVVE